MPVVKKAEIVESMVPDASLRQKNRNLLIYMVPGANLEAPFISGTWAVKPIVVVVVQDSTRGL